MDVSVYFIISSYFGNKLIVEVPGVTGQETNLLNTFYFCDSPDEFDERRGAVGTEILALVGGKVFSFELLILIHEKFSEADTDLLKTPGVNIHPEECHFPISLSSQFFHFTDNLMHRSRLFTSPRIGHDAEGAERITSGGNRHPGVVCVQTNRLRIEPYFSDWQNLIDHRKHLIDFTVSVVRHATR